MQAYRRMQQLTLEAILRVIFGGGDAELRDAVRRTLDMTRSLPRLMAMSLFQGGITWRAFTREIERMDAVIRRRISEAPADGSVLALLREARHEDGSPPTGKELRDELVTLLLAGHETTAGALGWALERLARHPDVLARLRGSDGDEYRDAVIKEVLRLRPVLSVAPRKAIGPFEVGGWTLPPGVHVTPCIYLTHRRPDLWPDPTAFRPQRFLDGPPRPYSFVPFGGGIRRCIGAAFATLEMHEVLRAVAARFELQPHGRPERMRRRAITLTPARGGSVIPVASF